MRNFISRLLLLVLIHEWAVQSQIVVNMNGEYAIANPNPLSPKPYSTDYGKKNASYFDVYSAPIKTVYAQVYWTVQNPTPIPPAVVEQFDGKVMAVIGYEVDQVFKTPNGDVSVPIYWSYNHHYEAWLLGSNNSIPTGPTNVHSYMKRSAFDPVIPSHSQFFSEGNGGEYRKSYHGYPAGYAQLLLSPKQFQVQPMQIDTRNRDYDGPGFKSGILPKSSTAPPNATYSGLLECPCTTRTVKTQNTTYSSQVNGTCSKSISNDVECFAAAMSVGVKFTQKKTVSSNVLPSGCSVIHDNNDILVMFNTMNTSAACGGGYVVSGSQKSLVELSMVLDARANSTQVQITMTGPVGVWYGVGFNATVMANLPYVIVIDGNGVPSEHKIGNHEEGKVLAPQVKLVSSKIFNNTRTVVLTRPFKGLTPDHYTFDERITSIPFINAIGSQPDFSYHKLKTSSNIVLTSEDGTTCLCNAGVHGYINNIGFYKACAPEPTGDLLQQKNPTCWLETYAGGLSCCSHETILLDADQPVDNRTMELHLKFRFYYQEYQPASKNLPAPSHLSLHRFYFMTEAWAGEYDVVQCAAGTPPSECVNVITARWKVADMLDCDPKKDPAHCTVNAQGIQLIYAGGHCHAPSCISLELYNADTGALLCRQIPVIGQGSPNNHFDELGYIAIPPCLWGYEDGLIAPTTLFLETNLLSVKKNNNTYGHYGEMASWQMRGVFL